MKRQKTPEERLQTKLERLKDFTPHASPERLATVADAAARHGSSLPHWDGLVYGLGLTLHPDGDFLLKFLELEQEPPEVRDAVAGYAAGIWARLDVSDQDLFDLSLNPELVGTVEQAQEWLGGLAQAIQLDPEPLRSLTRPVTTEVLGDEILSSMMLVMSFAQVEAERASGSAEWQDVQEMREAALSHLRNVEPEGRAQILQLLLMDVDTFYGYAAMMEKFGVTPEVLGNGERLEPIRREGRKIRPNEPCPCGSGKKYKKCHGAPGASPL